MDKAKGGGFAASKHMDFNPERACSGVTIATTVGEVAASGAGGAVGSGKAGGGAGGGGDGGGLGALPARGGGGLGALPIAAASAVPDGPEGAWALALAQPVIVSAEALVAAESTVVALQLENSKLVAKKHKGSAVATAAASSAADAALGTALGAGDGNGSSIVYSRDWGDALAGLPNLKRLNLRGNNLQTFPADGLADLGLLSVLNLSNCQLEGLLPRALPPKLRSLELQGNRCVEGATGPLCQRARRPSFVPTHPPTDTALPACPRAAPRAGSRAQSTSRHCPSSPAQT